MRPFWDRWYKTARWAGRRLEQLTLEPLCRMCKALGRLTPATVADHIIPHRGDETLFWEGELQSLCKPCHSSHKQAQEKGGTLRGCDKTGTPLDAQHHWNTGGGRV